MSIVNTITDEYAFWDWLNSDKDSSYYHYFSLEGAKAIQSYMDELSEDGYNQSNTIEFDPIAWCVEFSEYDSVGEAYEDHFGNYDDVKDETQGNRTPEQQLERFQDNTTVIELDNGHIILGEF